MKGYGPLFSLITVFSTLAGGLVGIQLRHRLSGAMAFTGGVVLGVALLDVMPESFKELRDGRAVGIAVAGGFLGFLILSRVLVLHHRDDPERAAGHHRVGALGAAALSVHSFVDGFGIGAAFAISSTIGAAVLIAVVSHDFADGMNTVTFVLSQRSDVQRARRWLLVDALAPVAGALVGAAVVVGGRPFGYGLAVYVGIFLMIGAGELLPEAHSEPSIPRMALTMAGFLLMLAVTGLGNL